MCGLVLVGINIVQEKADEARKKQTEIIEKGKIIADDKEQIEILIAEASEQLQRAKLSLAEFDQSTINEALEMDTPPDCVQIVGGCFLILNGIRDSSWKNVQDMLSNDDNFRKLLNINYHAITVSQLSLCKNHLKVSQIFAITSQQQHQRHYSNLCYASYLYIYLHGKPVQHSLSIANFYSAVCVFTRSINRFSLSSCRMPIQLLLLCGEHRRRI